jgi:hypothetical protein
MMEIQRCDALVANMWTKSIGTVVGIMQARRMGKPVILVDSSQIESRILKEIVGPENVIQDLGEVPDHLQKARARLERLVEVHKLDGTVEPFDLRKMTRSITLAFGRVDSLNDDWLPSAVAMQVHQELVSSGEGAMRVETETLKNMILASLDRFADPANKTLAESLKQLAAHARKEWKHAEERKRQVDNASECIDEKNIEISGLEAKVKYLEKGIKQSGQELLILDSVFSEASLELSKPADAVQAARERFSEHLVFSDDLDDTIGDCHYENPDAIYDCLRFLARYACEKKTGAQTVGLREWWPSNARHRYAPTESKTVLENDDLMGERTVRYRGKKHALREHIRLGIGGNCCRIYIKNLTSEDGSVLVGMISKHPATAV